MTEEEPLLVSESEPENPNLYYFKDQRCYPLDEKPENSVLLYFLIKDRKLENLYKKLFHYNMISMPFGDQQYRGFPYSYHMIEVPLLEMRLISDINIKIDKGNLESFDTFLYDKNSNGGKCQYVGRSGMSLLANTKISLDKGRLIKLSKILQINKSVTCHVTCRFFVIGRANASDYNYKYDSNDMFERYKKQFEIDENKKKLVFIDDDDNQTQEILNDLQSKPNNIIIPLPKYDTNLISYVLNNYNLNNFDNYFIGSNRIDSEIEKGSSVSPFRFGGGIRSMRKSTKKTKKTRKPRKKSRKSRKHKKSRKH